MEKFEQLYYPVPIDRMWNREVSTLLPWLAGKGIDIGCSNRSISKDDYRVDIDYRMYPDLISKADNLEIMDGTYDYAYAIHVLEHLDDTKKALLEWARIVKQGGVVAIVHPDVEFTGVQLPQGENPDKNRYNKHKHERTHREFIDWFTNSGITELELVSDGIAMQEWSFFAIFVKT